MAVAQDGGKVVNITHRPLLLPGNTPSTPQGHSAIGRITSMKIPMTPSGIEPATFLFVTQHLNHYAIAIPERKNSSVFL
jgi:hypothetical protein